MHIISTHTISTGAHSGMSSSAICWLRAPTPQRQLRVRRGVYGLEGDERVWGLGLCQHRTDMSWPHVSL
jgi:hypothetical protein